MINAKAYEILMSDNIGGMLINGEGVSVEGFHWS